MRTQEADSKFMKISVVETIKTKGILNFSQGFIGNHTREKWKKKAEKNVATQDLPLSKRVFGSTSRQLQKQKLQHKKDAPPIDHYNRFV